MGFILDVTTRCVSVRNIGFKVSYVISALRNARWAGGGDGFLLGRLRFFLQVNQKFQTYYIFFACLSLYPLSPF